MKLSLLASALLFASVAVAQLPSELDRLEGAWQCKNCPETTWSAWTRQPDGTLLNRTYTLVGLDTVDISRLEVSVRGGRHTVLRLTRPGQAAQTFRLTRTARYELFWENENLTSLQPALHMNFYGSKRMVVDSAGLDTMDFRRKRQKSAPVGLDKPMPGAHFASAH
jgi:hypothetical protein